MLGEIHGRLTRNPETRKYHTKSSEERTACNFSVASDNHYGNKTEASYYNCSIFGKRAEALAKFFSKGSEIVVRGYFEQDEYEKDGEKKRAWTFWVNDFDFCGSKGANNNTPSGFEENNEDIPF